MRRFRLATYDIDKNNGDFPNRIYELSNIVCKNKFDILCLQDDFNSSNFSSSRFLNLELDYNYITTVISKDNNSSSNLTILSKGEVTLLDEIYFKQKKDSPTACQFAEVLYNEHKILLINTKLCPIYSSTRDEQIKTILKEIKKYNNSHDLIIFCGSFNINPSFPEIKKISESGFIDINKEFTHQDKVISDYIFNKCETKIDIESKILLKGFSKHHCLVNIFKLS